jgi:hypothetical protein
MYNLIQKWVIWSVDKQSFFSGGKTFNYVNDPSLARIYHNYSDAIMACNQLEIQHHPVELRFHFNIDTLKKSCRDAMKENMDSLVDEWPIEGIDYY